MLLERGSLAVRVERLAHYLEYGLQVGFRQQRHARAVAVVAFITDDSGDFRPPGQSRDNHLEQLPGTAARAVVLSFDQGQLEVLPQREEEQVHRLEPQLLLGIKMVVDQRLGDAQSGGNGGDG